MSVKSAGEFFEIVAGNKSLQAKVAAVHTKATAGMAKASDAGVIKIAASKGFKITAKDLAQIRAGKGGKALAGRVSEVSPQWNSCGNYWCSVGWTYYGQP